MLSWGTGFDKPLSVSFQGFSLSMWPLQQSNSAACTWFRAPKSTRAHASRPYKDLGLESASLLPHSAGKCESPGRGQSQCGRELHRAWVPGGEFLTIRRGPSLGTIYPWARGWKVCLKCEDVVGDEAGKTDRAGVRHVLLCPVIPKLGEERHPLCEKKGNTQNSGNCLQKPNMPLVVNPSP